jgi:hypothetical protein
VCDKSLDHRIELSILERHGRRRGKADQADRRGCSAACPLSKITASFKHASTINAAAS